MKLHHNVKKPYCNKKNVRNHDSSEYEAVTFRRSKDQSRKGQTKKHRLDAIDKYLVPTHKYEQDDVFKRLRVVDSSETLKSGLGKLQCKNLQAS